VLSFLRKIGQLYALAVLPPREGDSDTLLKRMKFCVIPVFVIVEL